MNREKVIGFILYFTFLAFEVYAQPRQDEIINFDWKFIQEDIEGAQMVSFDDENWETVHLPHDASIYGAFIEDSLNSDRKNGFRPRLKGWYRKKLEIGQLESGKRYFLEFEGVYRDAKVFVNAQQVAHQLNGYQEFEVEITDVIKSGNNLIAVSYDNTDMESSRWYNGEGIYRDVWLKTRNDVYIIKDGTYITASNIQEVSADVNVQIEVLNDTDDDKKPVRLVTTLFNPQCEEIQSTTSVVPVGSGEVFTYKQQFKLDNPQLWSVENPNLYIAKTSVFADDELQDEFETLFGVRTVEFDPNSGMTLNGEKILLKGVNIHHDLGPLGAAAFHRGFERRLEGLKKLGCNAIRLAHNPHDKSILDWCDKNGMLVFDEAFDKWTNQFFGADNSFAENWEESLEAFIRRDRNHPSVFIWSVGNETLQQKGSSRDFGVGQLKKMMSLVNQIDPSRKITCGLHPARESGKYKTEDYYTSGPPEMSFYMDVVSTNYREEFWPMDHAKYPQLNFILSESQVGNLGNEWFNFNHDYGVGIFYWGGTDYIGESFGWPAKGWPNGIIDWNDHWKPFSYYIQSLYSEEPMVYIAGYDPSKETKKFWNEVNLRFQPMFSHWNWTDRDSVMIITPTNTQEVDLYLNGEYFGTKKVPEEYYTKDIKAYTYEEYDPENPVHTGPKIQKNLEWVVPYQAGQIEVRGKIEGEVVATYELQTAGDPYKIELIPDRDVINSDGLDLSYVTVKVVDKNGLIIPDADNLINFKVSGAGTNAGVGSANVISHEPFQANTKKVFQGKALLVLRAGREEGVINVKATAKGLKSAKIKVTVKE